MVKLPWSARCKIKYSSQKLKMPWKAKHYLTQQYFVLFPNLKGKWIYSIGKIMVVSVIKNNDHGWSMFYLSACRRLCLLWPWLVLLLRGVFFFFLVLHANENIQIRWRTKSICNKHLILAGHQKWSTNQNVSVRSVYKTKKGVTNKAEACQERDNP